MPSFTKNDVDSENRVRIPASLGPVKLEKRPVSFIPLLWQRPLLVDPEQQFHAWLLCHLDSLADGGIDWFISPFELIEYSGTDPEKLHLSSFISSVGRPTTYGKGGLRIQLPENIRVMGWLPERNQEIVILSDASGVSVWRPEVFEKHSVALNRVLMGRGEKHRPERI